MVSKVSESEEEASDMEESLISGDEAFMADEETAEVAKMSKDTFHFPTLAVTA